MAHDVFISYSSKDKPIADAVCAHIEATGIRCWIAPRDIAPGEDWPTAITKAISSSRVMVLIFSANSNASDDVGRELMLAASHKLVIIPFKVEDIEPEPGKLYYLARTHWLDAVNPPTKEQILFLVQRVQSILPSTGDKPVFTPPPPTASPQETPISTPPPPAVPLAGTPEQRPSPQERPSQPKKDRKKKGVSPWLALTFVFLGILGLLTWGFLSGGLGRLFASTSPTPTYLDVGALTPQENLPSAQDFSSFAGEWSGTMVNDSDGSETPVSITVEPTCSTGQICGSFTIPNLSCSGNLKYMQVTAGWYEFTAFTLVGDCGNWVEYLSPQTGGDLLNVRQITDSSESHGSLQRSTARGLTADFNDSQFDGMFDANTWTYSAESLPDFSIQQLEGAMVFSSAFLQGSREGKLNSIASWTLGNVTYIQARLKLDPPASGGDASIAVTLSDLGTWWVGCGISVGTSKPYAWCHDATVGDSTIIELDYGTWYTLKLAYNSQTLEFEGNIDGRSINSWKPASLYFIKQKDLAVSIGLWTDANTMITGYVDDVVAGK